MADLEVKQLHDLQVHPYASTTHLEREREMGRDHASTLNPRCNHHSSLLQAMPSQEANASPVPANITSPPTEGPGATTATTPGRRALLAALANQGENGRSTSPTKRRFSTGSSSARSDSVHRDPAALEGDRLRRNSAAAGAVLNGEEDPLGVAGGLSSSRSRSKSTARARPPHKRSDMGDWEVECGVDTESGPCPNFRGRCSQHPAVDPST